MAVGVVRMKSGTYTTSNWTALTPIPAICDTNDISAPVWVFKTKRREGAGTIRKMVNWIIPQSHPKRGSKGPGGEQVQ